MLRPSVVSRDRALLCIRSRFSVVPVDLLNILVSKLFKCSCLADRVLSISLRKAARLGWTTPRLSS